MNLLYLLCVYFKTHTHTHTHTHTRNDLSEYVMWREETTTANEGEVGLREGGATGLLPAPCSVDSACGILPSGRINLEGR